ncbi:ParB/RepB/Spo0J family partition protein [Micromonospora sp. NPDC000089]|uniref:ParB/RepB/Spo0J family partition protein n=1 Tax=unclassified Micromonospora TaxID=2617518 RepID=UPI003687FDE0
MPLQFTRVRLDVITPPGKDHRLRGRDRLILARSPQRSWRSLEVIEGHQRYWAAADAGADQVEALVRELHDDLELRLKEHYLIGGLTPVEEAEALDVLAHEWSGINQRDLAKRLGAKQPHISKRLRLLALPPGIKSLVHEYRITIQDALAMARQ